MNKPDEHWAKMTLNRMNGHNIGWAKQINELLTKWEMNENWEEIRGKTPGQWKNEVGKAAEKMNIVRLVDVIRCPKVCAYI